MRIIVNLCGITFDLATTNHAFMRGNERFDTWDIFRLVESIITDQSVADLLVNEVPIGSTAIVWDKNYSTIVTLKMEESTIIIITAVMGFNRTYYFAYPEDTCIYRDVNAKAEILPITDGGRFRPVKRQ